MNVFKKIEKFKIIPVIEIDRIEDLEPLIETLIESGLPLIEITLRNDAGKKAVEIIKKKWPEMILGAGTILTVENIRFAVENGADFGVSPGLNEEVVEEALKLNFNFSPGIATPTEIEMAMSYGITHLKFFPAEALGGIKMLKSIYSAYRHTGIKFNPTGGVNINNLKDYIGFEGVYAVGGTWIAKKKSIEKRDWKNIEINIKEALGVIGKI